MSAYETWCRTKNNLVKEPDSEYLQQVERNLREPALKDFLAMFAGELYDRYDEVTREPTAAEVEHFLINLDLLRAPSQKELDAMRAGLILNADATLQAMKRLNYTGDHTHTEVLDDVRQVLKAVLQGRPMPKLERFRCPSLYAVKRDVAADTSAGQIQCQLQLPHGDSHAYEQGSGEHLHWTDKQSLNPPVPYDDIPTVDRIGLREDGTGKHCGVLATVDGKTVACVEPIGSEHDVHRSADGRRYRVSSPVCPSYHVLRYEDGSSRGTVYCAQASGHEGLHQSANGHQWVSESTIREAEAVLEEQNRCESKWGTYHCGRTVGHEGPHQTFDFGNSWPTEYETCSEQMPNTLAITVCGRPPRHKGMHSSLTGGTWPQ